MILKRVETEQKIMFVYWKVGRICVCDNVSGVSKPFAVNLVVSFITVATNVCFLSLPFVRRVSAFVGYRSKNRGDITAEILSYSSPLCNFTPITVAQHFRG
jgi:hypothetical protein